MKDGVKQIETERLILRELVEEDAEEMFKNWASDDELSKYDGSKKFDTMVYNLDIRKEE